MVNDGVRGPERPRRGLDGLADRAGELDGTVDAGAEPGGRFRLVVVVPTGPAAPAPPPAALTPGEHA
jgi:hypothetical protein